MDISLANMRSQLDEGGGEEEGEGEDYIKDCREGIRKNCQEMIWQSWLCINRYRTPAIFVIEPSITELSISNCPQSPHVYVTCGSMRFSVDMLLKRDLAIVWPLEAYFVQIVWVSIGSIVRLQNSIELFQSQRN